ncbi:MAG TPA: hypothetical protein H9903_06250 [Candidatus Aquabacterium excrementipullorum]|nr:hypothetical protein [Candidatus Aquabacterium excrementipullorum]
MNTPLFLLSLLIAVAGPIVAVSYLRPILLKVLRSFCDADGGAEFWVRSAYLLAVSGTVFMSLVFGQFDAGATTVDTLRRALLVVISGVFVTVAFISSRVWGQVQRIQAEQQLRSLGTAGDASWPADQGAPS